MSQQTVGRLPAATPRLSDYPIVSEIRARYNDVDSYSHVNNVAIASYYEEARMDLARYVFGEPGDEHYPLDTRNLVVRIVIEYLAEAPYPGDFRVGSGISRLGRSSFTMGLALFLGETCIGTCETVHVHTRNGRATPLAPAIRRRFEEISVVSGSARP